MNRYLIVGLLIGAIAHFGVLVTLRVQLVPPGPGPSATTEFILIRQSPATTRTASALLTDPSVLYLPSIYSLRPSPGRYRELISPENLFLQFTPDSESSLQTTRSLRFAFSPPPLITSLVDRYPPFRFDLEHVTSTLTASLSPENSSHPFPNLVLRAIDHPPSILPPSVLPAGGPASPPIAAPESAYLLLHPLIPASPALRSETSARYPSQTSVPGDPPAPFAISTDRFRKETDIHWGYFKATRFPASSIPE